MQKHKVIKSFWNNNVPIPIDFTEAKVAMDLLFVKKKKKCSVYEVNCNKTRYACISYRLEANWLLFWQKSITMQST